MKAYKGFDKDLKCRDFQYEIGKEYEEDSAELCKRGFHACEHPLDCFNYYPPADSRYCEVEIDDNWQRQSSDTKVCGKKIKIGVEIGLKGLIHAAFEYTKANCTNSKIGTDKAALTGGNRSALTGGEYSVVYGGEGAKVRGGLHSVLAIQYWKNGEFVGAKFKEVDGEKIKADTFYRLDGTGRFIEVKDDAE